MVKEFSSPQQYALILGGSSGLGLASAEKLADKGMGIIIIHRNTRSEMKVIDEAFDSIKKKEVPFFAFNIDVLNKDKRNELMQFAKDNDIQFSCILHSIAKGTLKAMAGKENEALSTEDYSLTIQYMALSLYDWVSALHTNNLLAKDTRVIAFTSEGSSKAWRHYGAVAAAKSALEAIIRNMALEFAPYGVRANCIQAGVTLTASMQRIPGSDLLESYTKKRNPFKRMTTPEDVAAAVYLLCKQEAGWINGCIIPVDGGEHIS